MSSWNENDVVRDTDGRFDEKHHSAPETVLTLGRDLTILTPVDIDAELSELYEQRWAAYQSGVSHRNHAARYQKLLDGLGKFDRTLYEGRYTTSRDAAASKADECEHLAAELQEQMKPLEAEWRRRGGWSRAFLVTGGHLHRSMDCSTCNREGRLTRFAWMTDYSGADEESIVADAGERACTTCYPSAPVETLGRPSKMFTPDEEEAARQRAERDAEKARKATEKAAKAITNPDGTALREPTRYGQEVKTLVSAERELTDALMWGVLLERSNTNANPDFTEEKRQWSDILIAAIAAKKGITVDEAREAGMKKAEAKYKREWGR